MIKFKLSYLTMLIMNMAYMNDDLQKAFVYDQDIYSQTLSFMTAIGANVKDMNISHFISHIRVNQKIVMQKQLTKNLKQNLFKFNIVPPSPQASIDVS